MKNSTLCYIEKDSSYLMLHRIVKKNDVNRDKWIGIGGHFEENESPEECIKREIKEELDVEIKVEEFLLEVNKGKFSLQVYKGKIVDLENLKANVHSNLKWVLIKDLRKYQYPSADVDIIDYLEANF